MYDRLADWILKRMAAYRLGGVSYRMAARLAYGELMAAYKGRHWTGGKRTGLIGIPAPDALKQAEYVIREIREVYERFESADPGLY